MATRRYSLRALLLFFIAVCLLTGLIAVGARNPTIGLVGVIVGSRALVIALVSSVVGMQLRKVKQAAIAVTMAVLFADFVWIGLLAITGASIGVDQFLYNPLILMALVTSLTGCIQSRARALTIGLSLSIVLPTILALWNIVQLPSGPNVRGTGLAVAIALGLALAATITGTVSTVIGRLVSESPAWPTPQPNGTTSMDSRKGAKAQRRR